MTNLAALDTIISRSPPPGTGVLVKPFILWLFDKQHAVAGPAVVEAAVAVAAVVKVATAVAAAAAAPPPPHVIIRATDAAAGSTSLSDRLYPG